MDRSQVRMHRDLYFLVVCLVINELSSISVAFFLHFIVFVQVKPLICASYQNFGSDMASIRC